jgi:hypothetical protein
MEPMTLRDISCFVLSICFFKEDKNTDEWEDFVTNSEHKVFRI